MIKAVLFDLDGTLLDTAPAFHQLLNQQLHAAGRPLIHLSELRTVVSDGAAAMVSLAFDMSPEDPEFDHQLKTLLASYHANPAANTQLFPGMSEVLNALDEANIPWGIVTNKPERFTTPILQHLGLNKNAKTVICPDHVSERKPHPEGLLKAAAELGVAPEQCCYIGDHLRDIEAGRRANMATIAVTYGYLHDAEDPQSWNADAYAEHAEELLVRLGLASTRAHENSDETE